MKEQARLRAMAIRGEELAEPMAQDADVMSAIGGGLAGWGGKTGAAISKSNIGRADALRALAQQQTLAARGEAGDFARQGAQLESQRDIADLHESGENTRLALQLGAKREADAAEKAGKVSETEGKYRKELMGLQVVKDAMGMGAAYKGIQQALGQNSAAGDMAGIFQFMKVLDPTSSVREGEYANAKNSAGVPDQIRNLYNQAMSGKLLSSPQRKDFLGTAKGRYSSQLKEAKRYADAFGGLAQQDGGDPSRVVVGLDFGELEEPSAGQGLVQPKSEAEYAALPSGTIYLGQDGKPRKKK